MIAQATPDLLTYGLTSAAAAGPVGILLVIAVAWLARRDTQREIREREDRTHMITALAAATAAQVELRKESETLRVDLKEYRQDHREILDLLREIRTGVKA